GFWANTVAGAGGGFRPGVCFQILPAAGNPSGGDARAGEPGGEGRAEPAVARGGERGGRAAAPEIRGAPGADPSRGAEQEEPRADDWPHALQQDRRVRRG